MPDYRAIYHKLFSAQADAIESLETIRDILILAQQQAEELYFERLPYRHCALAPG